MELKPCDRSTIERALGIIEGVACGIPENAASMLYTAIELIECALQEEEPT
jgi:hypothetical protein